MSTEPSRRARQAALTRREILLAARALFAQQGYAGTSMAQIAERAEVSVQTLYDSVGSKSAIVRALNDLIDEEGEVARLAARIPDAEAAVDLIAIPVDISRNINERCMDIITAVFGAAAVEPEMQAVRDESRRRHREGVGRVTQRLAALGALRPGLAVEEAADTIAALTDPDVVRTFVLAYGWSWQDWHARTLDAITRLVLAPPPPRRRS
ncbi:MAG: TetR/AcrR family transcriptional regulator [Dehalococcoidia bacterium]